MVTKKETTSGNENLEVILSHLPTKERQNIVMEFVNNGAKVPATIIEDSLKYLVEQGDKTRGDGVQEYSDALKLTIKTGILERAFEIYKESTSHDFLKNITRHMNPNRALELLLGNNLIDEAVSFLEEKGQYKQARDLYLQQGRLVEAANLSRRAKLRDEESTRIYRKVSLEFEKQNKWEEAGQYSEEAGDFEKSIDLRVNGGSWRYALSGAQEWGLHHKRKQIIQEICESSKAISENDQYAPGRLSTLLENAKEEGLEVLVREFVYKEMNRLSAKGCFSFAGECAEIMGDNRKAIEFYNMAEQSNKKYGGLGERKNIRRGELAEEEGLFELAIESYAKADEVDYHYNRERAAALAFKTGFHKRNLELFYEAVNANFHHPCRHPFYAGSPIYKHIEQSEKYIKGYKGEEKVEDILSGIRQNNPDFDEFHNIALAEKLHKKDYTLAAFHARILGEEERAKSYNGLNKILSEKTQEQWAGAE